MTCKDNNTSIVLENAERYCADHGARFTDPRRFVLDILAKSGKAMTAYEILDAMGAYLDKPKPPTAYRAIEFWQEHGFIHRIESLNAYMVCQSGHAHKGSQFLICDDCGDVEEAHLDNVTSELDKSAGKQGFNVRHSSVELHGQCGKCT